MPARGVKVKKMQQKGSVEDANLLNDMFSQMTGSNNADSDIIIPKFIKLKELVTKYFKIFNLLINFDEFIIVNEGYIDVKISQLLVILNNIRTR